MRALAYVALTLLLAPPLARAEFEGVLDSKMSGRQMNGTGRTWLSSQGVRSEMEMELPKEKQAEAGKTVRSVVIWKASEPDTTYFLDETRKTWWSTKAKPDADRGDERDRWTAKRTGKDVVAGFACDVVLLTSSNGRDSEVCVTSALGGSGGWLAALRAREEKGGGAWKALRDLGVKGYPIRWRSMKADEPFSVEVVAARRQSVPASTFAIPAGYQRSEGGLMFSNPELSKKMDEAMKKLSPEQRKQMEEMMKKMREGKGE